MEEVEKAKVKLEKMKHAPKGTPIDKIFKQMQKIAELEEKAKGGNKVMNLLTKELEKKIPAFYTQEDKGDEAIVYAKFFTPAGQWTWYVMEYNPKERTFFGLVKGFEVELGYFSLDELERTRGPLGLGIERDLYFEPTTIGKLRKQLSKEV